MKKCSQCGSLNEDKYVNCIVCNNKLNPENKKITKESSFDDGFYIIKPSATLKEPFEVTLFDKIVGGAATAAIFASILHMFISKNQSLSSLIIDICSILVGVLITFFPNQIWKYSRKNYEKWYKNSPRLEPSDHFKNLRKAFILFYLIAGIYIFTTSIFL